MDRLTAVLPTPTFTERGFTLTEMAVVLVIVSLLIGGMILPMSAQQDIRYNTETQKTLADISEALIGFAASKAKPYLPCPDTNGDGLENRTGDTCTGGVLEGTLPWATLGLGRQDAWGNPFRYRVANTFSNSNTGFTLTTTGDIRVCDSSTCAAGTVLATEVPAIVLSLGKNGTAPPTDVNEVANTDGNTDFVQRTSSTGFDDIVVWLPTSILINRMISAVKLP
jgi:prepilin-type N-terminal cleavage/methylation domain-containing protein